MKDDCQKKIITFFFILSFSALILLVSVMSLVPPIFRDELTHHLAIPKLWIQNGSIDPIPQFLLSYYPMNVDLLYWAPLYFGNTILPKTIHFSFGLLTALLIYRYLHARTHNTHLATLGALIFLSLPIVVKLSISAYVDLGLTFFSWASIYFIFAWANSPKNPKHLIVSAVFCGLGVGTKYNGLIVLVVLTLFVPLVHVRMLGRPRGKTIDGIGYMVLFFFIAMMVYSPWMVRNIRLTGNPIYPLYQRQFSRDADSTKTANMSMKPWIQRKLIYHESAVETTLIPLRIFFQGQDDNPRYFDGQLNPMLCLLPLILLFTKKPMDAGLKMERIFLSTYSVVFLLYASFMVDMRIRYIAPIIPPLVVLTVLGIGELLEWVDGRGRGKMKRAGYWGIGILVSGFLGLNAHYVINLMRFVDPLPYVFGKMSREDYLEDQLPEYPAIQAVNQLAGDQVNVLALFLGKRLYYFDKPVRFETQAFAGMVNRSTDGEDLSRLLKNNGFSHCIVGIAHFQKWVNQVFDGDRKRLISKWWRDDCRLLFLKNGYAVFALNNHDGSRLPVNLIQ